LILTLFLLATFCGETWDSPLFAQSGPLKITPINENAYVHESYLDTDDFGKVACNGLVYVYNQEAVVFDTPTNLLASDHLINWLTDSLKATIKAIIPTHFHNDCTGGLQVFHDYQIPSIANEITIELTREHQLPVPIFGFAKDTIIQIGGRRIYIEYPGEGHTVDNIIAYIGHDEILFGGCLIKSIGAGKGFTGDANIEAWATTIETIKERFPHLKTVVPGHGMVGGPVLLDYTITLFSK
jgi:metallo-beta-lactamase class B